MVDAGTRAVVGGLASSAHAAGQGDRGLAHCDQAQILSCRRRPQGGDLHGPTAGGGVDHREHQALAIGRHRSREHVAQRLVRSVRARGGRQGLDDIAHGLNTDQAHAQGAAIGQADFDVGLIDGPKATHQRGHRRVQRQAGEVGGVQRGCITTDQLHGADAMQLAGDLSARTGLDDQAAVGQCHLGAGHIADGHQGVVGAIAVDDGAHGGANAEGVGAAWPFQGGFAGEVHHVQQVLAVAANQASFVDVGDGRQSRGRGAAIHAGRLAGGEVHADGFRRADQAHGQRVACCSHGNGRRAGLAHIAAHQLDLPGTQATKDLDVLRLQATQGGQGLGHVLG